MVGYWAGLLMFSRFSHPWTFRLARIAIVVGEFIAMTLKRQIQRPRPSQLSPALMPPVPVPGHASYPSGHATQAYLLSALMAQVMPAVCNGGPRPQSARTGNYSRGVAPANVLDRLAERVARNREVLGLHYRSDSVAGQSVAAQILPLLMVCPSMATPLTGVIAMAAGEW